MPKLWTATIEAHREAIRDATLNATADLVAAHGLRGVTMSKIAEVTGIGRATLYKYFPDIESILSAWHQRQVGGHLAQLATARDQEADPWRRLEAVVGAYAGIAHESRGPHEAEIAALLHRDEHVAVAEHQVLGILRDLLTEAAEAGTVRTDISADELARYCLHALSGASGLPSKAAADRLATVTLAGLRPDA